MLHGVSAVLEAIEEQFSFELCAVGLCKLLCLTCKHTCLTFFNLVTIMNTLLNFQLRRCLLLVIAFCIASISSAQVFNGSIRLLTQAEVDAFNYTEVTGALEIGFVTEESTITNLDSLYRLTTIGERLWMEYNDDLTNIDGLSGLVSVQDIFISDNQNLTNLDGLSGITSVPGNITIQANFNLSNMDGLSSLTSIGGSFIFGDNLAMSNIDGLSGITSVGEDLIIRSSINLFNLNGLSNLTSVGRNFDLFMPDILNLDGLSALTTVGGNLKLNFLTVPNLNGLEALTTIGGDLEIVRNFFLENLDGLSGVNSIGRNILVDDNRVLSDCCILGTLLSTPGAVGGTVQISNNAEGCNSVEELNCVSDCDIQISEINSIHETCPEAADGTLTVVATCASCTNGIADIRYSLDGTSFQENNTFTNLPVGSYTVSVRDVNDTTCTTSLLDGGIIIAGTDSVKPEIICPEDIVVSNDRRTCGANVAIPLAIASDNCMLATLRARFREVDTNNVPVPGPAGNWSSFVDDPSGFYPVGRYKVQWRAKDAAGNKKRCAFYLEVNDTEKPKWIAPLPDRYVTVPCREQIPAPDILKAIDNCSGEMLASFTEKSNEGEGTGSDPLIIRRIWEVIDEADNRRRRRQTIIVNDCPERENRIKEQSKNDGTVHTMMSADASVELEELTSAEVLGLNLDQVKLYPNPSEGQFLLMITQSETKALEVIVSNTMGQIVKIIQSESNKQLSLDLGDMPIGIYHLKIIQEEISVNRQMQVIR